MEEVGEGQPAARLPPLIASLLTLVFLVVLVRTAWISDDALISLRTVLNVTNGFGLTFNIDERVQTFTRRQRPSTCIRLRCTLGRNCRLVRGALRSHRPECLWRMLRPKRVTLSQRSHRPGAFCDSPIRMSSVPTGGARPRN